MPNNDEKKVLLKVTDLKQWFPLKKTKLFQKEQEYVRANDGITLNIYEGETVGLVGESGCGKSTFGRTLLQIYKQTEGKTMYYGRTLTDMAPLYVDETIKNIDFDIFAIGEDQNHEGFQRAVKWCEENGKQVVRMKRTPGICSSQIKKDL